MEKKLFFLLNLHLFTERQLFYIICIITIINMVIVVSYLYYKRYFVELTDVVLLVFCIIYMAKILFLIEHVTFFATLIYLHLFLVIVFLIFRQYRFKVTKK